MSSFSAIPEDTEKVGRSLLDAAIEVHRQLGPGFLERIYEEALCQELTWRGVPFECQKPVQVLYKGVSVGELACGRPGHRRNQGSGDHPVHS